MLNSDISSARPTENYHWRVTVSLVFYNGSRAVIWFCHQCMVQLGPPCI